MKHHLILHHVTMEASTIHSFIRFIFFTSWTASLLATIIIEQRSIRCLNRAATILVLPFIAVVIVVVKYFLAFWWACGGEYFDVAFELDKVYCFFSSFSPLANCQQVIAIETMANWQIYMKQKLIRVDVMVHKVYCDMWVDIRTIYHINLSLVCLDMNKNCIVTHNMSPQGFINETMMQTKYGWKNLLYKTFTELELMDIF